MEPLQRPGGRPSRGPTSSGEESPGLAIWGVIALAYGGLAAWLSPGGGLRWPGIQCLFSFTYAPSRWGPRRGTWGDQVSQGSWSANISSITCSQSGFPGLALARVARKSASARAATNASSVCASHSARWLLAHWYAWLTLRENAFAK